MSKLRLAWCWAQQCLQATDIDIDSETRRRPGPDAWVSASTECRSLQEPGSVPDRMCQEATLGTRRGWNGLILRLTSYHSGHSIVWPEYYLTNYRSAFNYYLDSKIGNIDGIQWEVRIHSSWIRLKILIPLSFFVYCKSKKKNLKWPKTDGDEKRNLYFLTLMLYNHQNMFSEHKTYPRPIGCHMSVIIKHQTGHNHEWGRWELGAWLQPGGVKLSLIGKMIQLPKTKTHALHCRLYFHSFILCSHNWLIEYSNTHSWITKIL